MMFDYENVKTDAVCRLYLDLEFSREMNGDRNGSQMTEIYLKYVCAWLFKIYGVKCSAEDILLLDATTEKKFSQHAIFHMPGAAFRNNVAAGRFIRHIHAKLLTFLNSGTTENVSDGNDFESSMSSCRDELSSLFVKHPNGSSTTFYDLGVYSRNRNFRLFGATKLGKQDGELVVAAENKFTYKIDSKQHDFEQCFLLNETLFLHSLVCNIKFSDQMRILDFDEKPCQSQTSIVRLSVDPTLANERTEGYASSPFPKVDEFVISFIKSNSRIMCGRIWRWAYFGNGGTIVYDIVGNRWCANMQREHRSNNIYIVVDLNRQVLYQKCHDPECRAASFKSQEYELPQSVYIDHLVNTDDISDIELLNAATELDDAATGCIMNRNYDASDDELIQAAMLAETSDVTSFSCS